MRAGAAEAAMLKLARRAASVRAIDLPTVPLTERVAAFLTDEHWPRVRAIRVHWGTRDGLWNLCKWGLAYAERNLTHVTLVGVPPRVQVDSSALPGRWTAASNWGAAGLTRTVCITRSR